MSHIVAIPCLYYLTVEGDVGMADAQYEGELYRTAWDSGAPLPEQSLVRPDMAGDILAMESDLSLADDPQAPEYRVSFKVAAPSLENSFSDIPKELLNGEHEILVAAR